MKRKLAFLLLAILALTLDLAAAAVRYVNQSDPSRALTY